MYLVKGNDTQRKSLIITYDSTRALLYVVHVLAGVWLWLQQGVGDYTGQAL